MSEQQQGQPARGVEAWGLRLSDDYAGERLVLHVYRDSAVRDQGMYDPRGTVVPLIAADRLTSNHLAAVVARLVDERAGYEDEYSYAWTLTVLAALRTHLEQTGADA